MYRNRALNIVIFIFAVPVFAASVYLVRSPRTIDDVAWMRAMSRITPSQF